MTMTPPESFLWVWLLAGIAASEIQRSTYMYTHTHTHDVPKEPEGRKRGSKDERREQLGP